MTWAWFGPLVPLLAFAQYWYIPVVGMLMALLVALAVIEDYKNSKENGSAADKDLP